MSFTGSKALTGEHSILLRRLWKFLHDGGVGTKVEIAKACFSTPKTLGSYLDILRSHGLARICRFDRKVARGTSYIAVFKFGPGRDARKPSNGIPLKHVMESPRALQILGHIKEHGPRTAGQLSREIGFHREYASRLCRLLRDEKKLYACGWQTKQTPILALGKGPDTLPPVKKTAVQASRDMRLRKKGIATEQRISDEEEIKRLTQYVGWEKAKEIVRLKPSVVRFGGETIYTRRIE